MAVSQNPFSWTVDQLVAQACSRTSELYANGPEIRPILNLEALETALRDNDVNGEVFLSLEDVQIKEDLNITSLGQRRELLKVVHYLRSLSERISCPKRQLESTAMPDIESEPKKRRVQPENLSTVPVNGPTGFDALPLNDDDLAFLGRHQEYSDDEVLRPYNESDLEKDIDSDDSLGDDLQSNIGASDTDLAQEDVDRAIQESVLEYTTVWNATKLAKKYKAASRRWTQAARAGTRKPQQYSLQRDIDRLQSRLDKLINAIAAKSQNYYKIEEVKKICPILEATVEDIAERQYYLQVLRSNEPPPIPSQAQYVSQPQQALEEGEEILESSESEEEMSRSPLADDEMSWISEDDSGLSLPYDPEDHDWNPRMPPDAPPDETIPDSPVMVEEDPWPENPFFARPILEQPIEPLAIPISAASTVKHRAQTPQCSIVNTLHNMPMEEEDSDLDEPRLPQSRYWLQGTTQDTAITLGSSPSDSEHSFLSNGGVTTPPLNPSKPLRQKDPKPSVSFPPIKETRAMKWKDVKDPFMALCKVVYKHDRENARDVLEHASEMTISEMPEVLRAKIAEIQDIGGDEEAIDNVAQDPAILWTYFFIVFACGKGFPEIWRVPEVCLDDAYDMTNAKTGQFARILMPLLQFYIDTKTQTTKIHGGLPSSQTAATMHSGLLPHSRSIVRGLPEFSDRFKSPGGLLGAHTPTRQLTDTETDVEEPSSVQKQRKRHVQQSQEALMQQQDDQYRVQAQEARRLEMMQRFHAEAAAGNVQAVPIISDPLVQLDPHIARRVKEHQIEGIQFIWRELIMDPKHQGCLLAHTMGLGKTMQVISFLVTLAQVNKSVDPRVRDLVPTSLRSKKVLIVCPASLVDNWHDEILMWTPPKDTTLLGGIYKGSGQRAQKVRTLREWNKHPGILIISYESLKALLSKGRSVTDEEHALVQKSLLQDPCVVVADEAHKLKNAKSAVNRVAKQIRTLSRIALTGSPLNNHLEEYHTMIDWIAPGYLGTMVQFRAKYSEPIQRGLYADSTRYDKRKSLERLYVLKQDLAAKIDRKDISAIAADMPQKTEFFITVPLTELQKEMYTILVKDILRGISAATGGNLKASNAQLWAWLAILSWLNNHPSCLIKKLQEKDAEVFDLAMKASEIGDNLEMPSDIDLRDSPIARLLPKFLECFKAVNMLNSIEEPALSTRASVTQSLIKESIEQNDKILVFSHSIPTLDFLQIMLDNMGIDFLRIDGSTKTDQRQDATKHFNNKDSEIMVFLISTRAGGLGLNLQGANRVVIYDFGFNPSWEEQAIGRAYRLGQKKPVFVYRFLAGGTFEEAIHNKSVFKTQLFQRVVDSKNVVRISSMKTEDYLFVPIEAEQHDLTDCIGKDPLLDRVVERAPHAIKNLVLTETFSREDEEDQLTEQEKEQAEEAVQAERLMRDNPEEYHRQRIEKERKERVQQQQQVRPASTYRAGQPTVFEQFFDPAIVAKRGGLPTRPISQASQDDSEYGRASTEDDLIQPPGCAQQ